MPNTAMHFTLLVVFFTTTFISHFGFATEEGIDIFLKAIDRQQNNSVIFSGKGSYDLTKSIASKTEKEIQEECDQMIADFKKTFPNHPMAETIISNIPEAVKTKYSQKQTFSGTFRFDYSKKDYQYIENQLIYDGNSKMPVTVIEKRALPQKMVNTEAAMLDPSISQVIVNNSASTVADFCQFGRLRGVLASLMIGVIAEKGEIIARDEIKKQIKEVYGNNKDLTILEIVKTKPYDNDSTSYTIESAVNGKVTQRYTIVPSLGYICPKIEFFDLESGNLIEDYEAKDFVLSPRSGLYFPTFYIESRFDSSGKLVEKREYKINQETLLLNETMSPKEFSLNIPEGLKVVDMRDGKNVDYVAEESGVLSLESGGLDLKQMSWLKIPSGASKISSEKSHLFVRLLLMMIGLSLIIWALIKRRRDKKIQNLCLFLISLFLLSGCSSSVRTMNTDVSKIKINPARLDFGNVRPSDSPVVMSFDITNNSRKDLVISSITSGCGCTVLETPQGPILPGQTVKAAIKVNLLGKMGDFKNSVAINTENHGVVSLEVRGIVETDIWYNEQSIRCTAAKSQNTVHFSLNIYTKKYPDIEFDWTKLYREVTAKIVSRENRDNGETLILLEGDINIGDNAILSSSLNLVPTNNNIAPLVIPVYCSRDEENHSAPQLVTSQISLGVLDSNKSTAFSVFGDPDILQVVRSVELKNVPDSFSIQRLVKKEASQNSDELQFQLETQNTPAGIIEGSLILKTAGNRMYTIPLICEIR